MKRLLVVLLLLTQVIFVFAQKQERTAVRGVWVPAPRFTSVLHSYQNVKNFVKLLDKLNFNSIYLVSYAETKTIYPSRVLAEHSTYPDSEAGYFLKPYLASYNIPEKSPTNDPVRDLITEAHKRKIKVFFWFEYGFMGEGRPISEQNPLLAKNPSWQSIGNDQLPANYNQHDYYFNAYNPEVQEFLIKLVEEAIELYPDLDGIQGDDRMPAMPRNSGYDSYTVSLFQKEHAGAHPPKDINDPEWVRWRLNKLNDFAGNLFKRIKAKNENVMLSFAPNPYPWSMENLMQEWPRWIKDGTCDLLAVQCYRYNLSAYEATVREVIQHVKESKPSQLFATGIILMEGSAIKMTPKLLEEQISVNRKLGINNEIYFYNEALNDKNLQRVFKKVYKKKADFPRVKND